MFDDGIHNDFEEAHQKGLRRGFDLGWTYKGRFDRQIIKDHIDKLNKKKHSGSKYQICILKKVLEEIENHPNNRENITFNSW